MSQDDQNNPQLPTPRGSAPDGAPQVPPPSNTPAGPQSGASGPPNPYGGAGPQPHQGWSAQGHPGGPHGSHGLGGGPRPPQEAPGYGGGPQPHHGYGSQPGHQGSAPYGQGYGPQGSFPGQPGTSTKRQLWASLPQQGKIWLYVALGGAAAMLLGSLGAWVNVRTGYGTISVNGTEGDGVLTLLLSLAAAGVLLAMTFATLDSKVRTILAWVAVGCAALSLIILLVFFGNMGDAADLGGIDPSVGLSVGWGVIFLLLGTLALGAGAVILALKHTK